VNRNLSVRPARPDDRRFVLETAKRLDEFGPPPWQTAESVVTAESPPGRASPC
jgi:hypothetical protein